MTTTALGGGLPFQWPQTTRACADEQFRWWSNVGSFFFTADYADDTDKVSVFATTVILSVVNLQYVSILEKRI